MSSDAEMDAGPSTSQSKPKVRFGKDKLAYDPDQDPEERRRVRREYRELYKEYEKSANPNEYTADELREKVKQADQLFDKVQAPQEATLDSNLLLHVSNMGAQKARAMKSSAGAFDTDDFVSKLITFMGGQRQLLERDDDDDDAEVEVDEGDEALDWDRIGRKAMAKSLRVPVMDFMLGPLSVEQKKRTQVKRAKLEKDEKERKAPQEIREEDVQRSENETSSNVAEVNRILTHATEDDGSINLFRFFINPDDFAQSVENLFHLSFLVRDGKCTIEPSEETGEPIVYACDEPTEDDFENGLKKQQMILEFDMETWERAKEVFNIRESMIPHRVATETTFGSKGWHG